MSLRAGKLLMRIQKPSDLKSLSQDELVQLCSELREFIIESVSLNPGHFGASLGVVELTVALHFVFNTPDDKLVWDVGHQAYAHKILTGRREEFHANRKYGGLSGFPKMEESPFDAFGTGHSSTSISAALGMALASKLKGEDRQHIAVIGDGSMTAGLAFEAMNHAGVSDTNLLIILNDNGISIDDSVGALKESLTDITTSRAYNKLKDDVWRVLGGVGKLGPEARRAIQKVEGAVKSALFRQSNFFESLRIRYFGPVDGHDVKHLTRILSDMKNIRGPKLLHVITVKGKGYPFAEKYQTRFHAPGSFNIQTGETQHDTPEIEQPPRFQDVFGHTILELARTEPRVVGITPAMPTGCSLNIMMGQIPERTFDVGIAEQHAVTFAAGLASQGFIPFCNIYSSFFQRAYDQLIHDVALQKLPVIFCLDRAGLVGEDGPTHHGAFDLSFLRCVPGVVIASPMNEEELRNLMYTAQLYREGPFVIRYPRGHGVMKKWQTPFRQLAFGKGRKLKEGSDMALVSIGPLGNGGLAACERLESEGLGSVAFYDLRFLKPLDEQLLHEIFSGFQFILTLEDNAVSGGMGSALLEFMGDHGYQANVRRLGIPDRFVSQGKPMELYRECGLDGHAVYHVLKETCAGMQHGIRKKATKYV